MAGSPLMEALTLFKNWFDLVGRRNWGAEVWWELLEDWNWKWERVGEGLQVVLAERRRNPRDMCEAMISLSGKRGTSEWSGNYFWLCSVYLKRKMVNSMWRLSGLTGAFYVHQVENGSSQCNHTQFVSACLSLNPFLLTDFHLDFSWLPILVPSSHQGDDYQYS